MEKPKSATAVSSTLTVVTTLVPSHFVSRSDISPDIIVPPEIIIDTKPIYDSGTSNAALIVGHAEPRSESGSPKLINAIYITASKRRYIC